MKNNIQQDGNRLFRRFSLLTLVAVYLLILVGGIVRSTGSGMGCPDWPKCFGQWVPPTDISELPADYKDVYADKRARKNKRFASYLTVLGFSDTANQLLADKSILEESEFNATKTWIEYVNRLVGVLIGLFIVGTFVLSIPFRKKNRGLFYSALSALILVVFQGWIGSIVVSTNLVPWMVTIHMLIALIIVCLLINIYYQGGNRLNLTLSKRVKNKITMVLLVSMILLIVQIVLGTQVREMIDKVAISFNYVQRESWISALGTKFIVHRSFSWLILISHLLLVVMLFKQNLKSLVANTLLSVIVLSIITGVIMAYFSIPAYIQPAHLLLGTLAFGVQFLLFLELRNADRKSATEI